MTTFEHLVGLHGKPVVASVPPPAPTSSDSAIATSTSISTAHHRSLNASAISTSPSPSRRTHALLAAAAAQEARVHRVRYYVLRPVATLFCVGLAIAIPEFDRVLAFLGSASAFVICVIGPVGAYLIVGAQGSKKKRVDAEREAGTASGLEALCEDAAEDDGEGAGHAAQGFKHPTVAHARQVHAAELARRKRAAAAAVPGEGEPLVVAGWERGLCWLLLVVSVIMASVGTVWSFLPVEEAGLR